MCCIFYQQRNSFSIPENYITASSFLYNTSINKFTWSDTQVCVHESVCMCVEFLLGTRHFIPFVRIVFFLNYFPIDFIKCWQQKERKSPHNAHIMTQKSRRFTQKVYQPMYQDHSGSVTSIQLCTIAQFSLYFAYTYLRNFVVGGGKVSKSKRDDKKRQEIQK